MQDLNDSKAVKYVKHMSLHVILGSDPQPYAQHVRFQYKH